jgi:DNA-binding CsgD family transcriptional regulator/tetratricopeptide (TPR) repeat protein
MTFVGRERELSQLSRALEVAADGQPTRIALGGPAGVGVTRLIDELISRISGIPGVVLARGTAREPYRGVPFAPVGEALGRALAETPDERLDAVVANAADDLVALVPELGPRLDALGIDRRAHRLQAPEQAASRVTEAVVGALQELGRGGVVLLALEDLHWADPATHALVLSLLRTSRRMPLCLVISMQADALHRRHPAAGFARLLADAEGLASATLAPLTSDETAALAEAQLGEVPSGSQLAALVEGSRGDPLAIEQLALASKTLDGVRLSDPFEQILGARLDALGADAVRVVRTMAAAREPIGRETLLALRLPDGRLTLGAIAEAEASGLVNARGDAIEIAHERYAEAVEDLSLVPEQHAVHAALAALSTTMTERPGRAAIAAWHWQRAGRSVEARRAHLTAASRASRLDPTETTLQHLQAAIELSDGDTGIADDDQPLWSVFAAAARAAAASGEFRRASALIRRAIEQRISRRSGVGSGPRDASSRRDLAGMNVELGRYRWSGGDLAGGLEALEHALTLLPPEPTVARAHALATLAQHLMIDGQFEASAKLATEARSVARETARGGDQEHAAHGEYGHATCTLGVDVAYQGDLDRGLALLEEATAVARAEGRLDDLMRAYANRTTLLDLDTRREAALAVVKDGLRDAREGGLSATYGAFLRGNAADILYQLGRWNEAETESRAAMEWPPAGVAWFSPTLYLGLILVESRADDEAERLLGRILLQLEAVPAGQWTALVQRSAVSLALWRGDLTDALAVAAREWDRVLDTDDPMQIAIGASTSLEAAAAASDDARLRRDFAAVAQASELGARVLPQAEATVGRSALAPNLGARREADLHLQTARAHAMRLRGRPDAAAWARLAHAWAAVPVPYQSAKCSWWQALAVLQTGEARAEAQAAIHAAWHIAVALPALPLQRALADLASRSRLNLPDGAEVPERRPTLVPVAMDVPVRDERGPIPGRDLVPVGPGIAAAGRADAGEAGTPGDLHSEAARQIAEKLSSESGDAAFGLSPREMEVLEVISEGRTNREIADRLFISERTVAVHVRHILAKLEVASRTEAAGTAIRLGLVAGPTERSQAGLRR